MIRISASPIQTYIPRIISILIYLRSIKRETGFEPATPSLEGSRSSQLSYSRLLPPSLLYFMERGGFEPPKAYAGRFTVCSLWPLGNLSRLSSEAIIEQSWR